jgi:hypothetical protein
MPTAIYGHLIRPRRPETLAKFDQVLAIPDRAGGGCIGARCNPLQPRRA